MTPQVKTCRKHTRNGTRNKDLHKCNHINKVYGLDYPNMPNSFEISAKPTVLINKQGINLGCFQNHTLIETDLNKITRN